MPEEQIRSGTGGFPPPMEGCYLDEPKEKTDKDLTLLRFHLQQLISA